MHHQVPGVIVAVDEDPGLGERRLDEEGERFVEHPPLRSGRRPAEMGPEKPLRKQLELRGQPRAVVWRHRVRRDRALHPYQRRERVTVQRGRVRRVEPLQIGHRTEVAEQQEPPVEIHGVDLRHVHAGRPQQARHVNEGPRVFLVGRGVHHHERLAVRPEPQVAAKARIAGEGLEASSHPGRRIEPVAERSVSIAVHRSPPRTVPRRRAASATVARSRPIISNTIRCLPPGSPPTS